ncbi:MAG: hypothetical protein HUK24_03855 [Sphaerochaetaceae bacterium]|nr:hypothetical protein [Sphaerochaetaceae bacterium]
MDKVVIVYTKGYEEKAKEVALSYGSVNENVEVLSMASVTENPQSLENFNILGLLYSQEGNNFEKEAATFVTKVLSQKEKQDLYFLFALAHIPSNKFRYTFRAMEKLCSKAGCALSQCQSFENKEEKLSQEILQNIVKENYNLAKGSPFPWWYMKLSKNMKEKCK